MFLSQSILVPRLRMADLHRCRTCQVVFDAGTYVYPAANTHCPVCWSVAELQKCWRAEFLNRADRSAIGHLLICAQQSVSFVVRTRQTELRQLQNVPPAIPLRDPEPAAAAPAHDPWKATDPWTAQPAAGAPATPRIEELSEGRDDAAGVGREPDEAGHDRDQGGDRGWQ